MTLYIISTPIGNMEDITLRGIRTLSECDIIAAEDTRRTSKLFLHHSIRYKRMVCYNDMNKERISPKLITAMKEGMDVGLATDSGTPTISDPGFYLVRECVREGIKVSPVPGACAAIAALSCSGLATDRFAFFGFLPKKGTKRKALLEGIKTFKGTSIIYESPYRIKKSMQEIAEAMPDARCVVLRELTKKFEEAYRGNAGEVFKIVEERKPKGEHVILLNTD